MSPDNHLKVSIKRKSPVVWLKRVVLFNTIEPVEKVREVTLHRGFNIIWGVDEDGDDNLGVIGHGVGKTSFCRLVRYCLGEQAFGTKDARERIRAAFPRGYVAAEVYLAGEKWAVARPIGESRFSYATKDITIEEMLEKRPSRDSYHEFRKEVEKLILDDLPAKKISGSDQDLKWEHVLSWCTRDQEARYQKVWEWRSPRSESETPMLDKPKVDGLFVIRTVLGLLTGDEAKHVQSLSKLEKQINETNVKIDERKKEPEYWCRHNFDTLRRLLSIPEKEIISLDSSMLFSLPNKIEIEQKSLSEEVGRNENNVLNIDSEISSLSARIQSSNTNLRIINSHKEAVQSKLEELETGAQAKKGVKDKLNSIQYESCELGDIPLKDCEYIQRKLELISFTDTADIRKMEEAKRNARELLGRYTSQIKQMEEEIRQLTKERKDLIEKRNRIQVKLSKLSERADLITSTYTAFCDWKEIFDGKKDDTELNNLSKAIETLRKKQSSKQSDLIKMLGLHNEHIEELNKVFDGTVKESISGDYSGILTFDLNDLGFQITRNKALAGEAIETLSILLADISAVILGIAGKGYHPGFLIHDSPREADLGARIYSNYLRFVARLHSRWGGKEEAPFQYIVTTTTPPPADLLGDEYLSLKLDATSEENMLFCKNLGRTDSEYKSQLQLNLEDIGGGINEM